jgi:hypothetical protein
MYALSKYEVSCIDEAGNESDRSEPLEIDPTQGKLISVFRSETMLINNRTQ